jgi:hypothetical protein
VGLREHINSEHTFGLQEHIHEAVAENQPHGVDCGSTIGEAARDTTTARAPAATAEVWGRSGRCPKCNGPGYLDLLDMIERIQYEHCTDCFHKWSVSPSETVPAS